MNIKKYKPNNKQKKKGIETTVVEGIPQWSVNYFVNDETGGLDEEDLKLVMDMRRNFAIRV